MTEKKITVGIIQQQNTGDIADNKKKTETSYRTMRCKRCTARSSARTTQQPLFLPNRIDR